MQQTFIEILRSSVDERRALFETVAAALETQAANVEKDLYVCWVLDFLFNRRGDDPIGLYFKGGTSLSKAYGLIRRFSEDIDIGIYKADLHVPLEADIAALPSVNQQQRALADKVDEAARQYISGPLKELLAKEIATVGKAIEQSGHFTLGFGFDPYRNKDALDILVLGYKSVFESAGRYVQAAVRIEGGARPDPEPAEPAGSWRSNATRPRHRRWESPRSIGRCGRVREACMAKMTTTGHWPSIMRDMSGKQARQFWAPRSPL